MTSLASLASLASDPDPFALTVLADLHEQRGDDRLAEILRCPVRGPSLASGLDRSDVLALWNDELPKRGKTRKRVDRMTDAESAQMAGWAQ